MDEVVLLYVLCSTFGAMRDAAPAVAWKCQYHNRRMTFANRPVYLKS